MKRIITIIILFLMIFTSCKKVVFPNVDDLAGTWIEQTNNSDKHKLIFEQDTLFFQKSNTIDTLLYRLDKKQERMYLTLINNPSAGESNHKILLKKSTLTIWGFFPSTPENQSETMFREG